MKPALLLAPGAGASSDSPALLAVEAALGKRVVVKRMDFPYRLAGRKAPDRQPVLIQAVNDAYVELAARDDVDPDRIYLGGRSMGGRMCSIAVAEGLHSAGLVLLSYPLHPPGRPEKLRIEHFPSLDVPCVFVSGDRDAFGTPAEMEQHSSTIPGSVEHQWIQGGDHGMVKHTATVALLVSDWFCRNL